MIERDAEDTMKYPKVALVASFLLAVFVGIESQTAQSAECSTSEYKEATRLMDTATAALNKCTKSSPANFCSSCRSAYSRVSRWISWAGKHPYCLDKEGRQLLKDMKSLVSDLRKDCGY